MTLTVTAEQRGEERSSGHDGAELSTTKVVSRELIMHVIMGHLLHLATCPESTSQEENEVDGDGNVETHAILLGDEMTFRRRHHLCS